MLHRELPSIRVSVIVPVYNDAARLTKCLDALVTQTLPHDQFEVVVVDNGSDEPPEALVARYGIAMFGEESRPGSYAARNKGLQMARGEVLAFTDSDCLPHANWLESALAVLEGPDRTDVVAGRIDVLASDPAHPTAAELFDIAIRLDQRHRVKACNGVVTANMVTRRDMFDRVGPFNDSLMSGADAEWSSLAAASGYSVRYVDEAVVIHPARSTLSEILLQSRRRAGGRFDIQAGRARRGVGAKTRLVVKRLMPRFTGLVRARRRLAQRGYGWSAWIRVVLIMQLVHYAGTIEFVRQLCGAEAERR